MAKQQVNARLDSETLSKLAKLSVVYGTTTTTLAVAIDRLYISTFPQQPTPEDEAEHGAR